MAAKILGKGKRRQYGGGRKVWRATLFAPTSQYPSYRLRFKVPSDSNPDVWVATSRSRASENEARELFMETERWLDGLSRHSPSTASQKQVRTMKALGEAAIIEAREQRLAARTVEQRESHLRAHIVPTIGKVRVDQWGVDHSRKVLDAASKTRTPRSLEDIRTTLSTMRKLAWREGWLPRSVNPLEGLKIARKQDYGASAYIDTSMRPETRMVDAMACAADHLVAAGHQEFGRFPFLGARYRVAGYGGLRLGEQLGLRAIDVYLDEGNVSVNGSWTQPRAADSPAFRGPVKNKLVHRAPIPASLMDELVEPCRRALGLPGGSSRQQVVNSIVAERRQRALLAPTPDRWWEVQIAPEEECWLWVDTISGLPPRSELHNHYWHKVRRWVDHNDADDAWPKFIPYRNMRHHAAMWWHDELELDWADVALFLGDKLTTVLGHYVLPGADALSSAAKKLSAY
jgi:hypothetical protein